MSLDPSMSAIPAGYGLVRYAAGFMTNVLRVRHLIAAAFLLSSCVPPPYPFEEMEYLPVVKHIPCSVHDCFVGHDWVGYVAPVSTSSDVPFFPSEEQSPQLARCVEGRKLCTSPEACFGWVSFSFGLLENGQPENVIFDSACPYPILLDPFFETVESWTFPRRKKLDSRTPQASTILAYPISPRLLSEYEIARRITSP